MGGGDFRQFIVEILLRARDEISRVAQQAAESINKVTDAQKQHSAEQGKAAAATNKQTTALDQLVAAHTREKKGAKESADAIRKLAQQREAEAKAIKSVVDELNREIRTERAASTERQRQHVEKISQLRAEAAAREANLGKIDKEVKAIRREAAVLATSAQEEASTSQRKVSTLNKEIASRRNNAEVLRSEAAELHRLANEREKEQSGLKRFFSDLRRGAADADVNLARLGASFRGFQVAFVIKYAQALISSLTALAATLFSVASSAVQAGTALAGSLVAGAAQALPVVGALIAAFARVTAVIKAVSLHQQNSLLASRDQQNAAEARRNAAERVRSALESEADAQRTLTDATRERNQALKEARAELDDVIAKEREAKLAAEASTLSVEQAQSRLRQAMRSGGSSEVAAAQNDLAGAREGRTTAGRDLRDATADANFGRRTGMSPDGAKRVEAAEKQVAAAQRDSARAARAVAEARHDAAVATDQQTSANDRLDAMLAQLSPVERALYRSILRVQTIWRQNVRPITDIIVSAFGRAVDRVAELLQNNRILAAFRRVATAVADTIDKLVKVGTDKRSQGFFVFLSEQIQNNAPIITRIITRLFRIFQNLAVAGAPAFRVLLRFVSGLAGAAEKATSKTGKLSDFFLDGIRHLKAWVRLAGSVINLFAALSGAGGAEAGIKSVKAATDYLNGLADSVRGNRGQIAKFFEEARGAAGKIFGVFAMLGAEIIRVFSPSNVDAFASFLTQVLIPAIGNVVRILGFLTTIVHQFLSLPVVSDLAQWVLTVLAVGKALQIFKSSLLALRLIALSLLANPWIALIVGLVAAVLVLDRRFHFLSATLDFLKRIGGSVFKFLSKVASDAFDWIKGAARDVAAYFSDVWSQGLLKWLRWPWEKVIGFFDKLGVFDWIKGAVEDVIGFFGEGSLWSTLGDIITWPFKQIWKIAKPIFSVIKEGILLFLDVIAGRFDKVGSRIADIWYTIFSTIHAVLVDVINGIVGAVNTVIGAFNKLPGPNIGKIDVHLRKMPVSRESAQTLADAKAGKKTSEYEGPHAQGGMLKATPGGKLITAAEAGFDEVVLTTDPKYAARQKELLAEYLKRMAPHFAKGGWVQGAIPTPAGNPITGLAKALFAKGFSVTSAWRPGAVTSSGNQSNHALGNAIDFGDSVNNIRALWKILFPLRRGFAELGGPTYVSRGRWWNDGVARNIAGSSLQAEHEDHIHVAILSTVARLARRIGSALGGNLSDAASLVADLPKELTDPVRKILGTNPGGKVGGFASGALGGIYKLAAESVKAIQARAGGMTSAAGGTIQSTYTGPLNRRFPSHFIDQASGHVRLSDKQVRTLAQSVGLPAWFSKISRGESNNFPGVVQRDPGDGMVGYGLFQNTPRAWGAASAAYKYMMRLGGIGAMLNPVKNSMMAKFLYEHAASKVPGTRGFPWYGTSFLSKGGPVPGYGGGDRHHAMLEGGEHVFSKEEVVRAGGHGMLRALRKMLGGGKQGGPTGYDLGGAVVGRPGYGLRSTLRDLSDPVSSELAQILEIFTALRQDAAKSKHLASRLRTSFLKIFEDGGLFSQLTDEFDAIPTRRTARLQRRQFSERGGRFFRNDVSAVDEAQFAMGTLTRQRGNLREQGDALAAGLSAARRARTIARRRGDAKGAAQAKSEINRILGLQQALRNALAQNTQDVVEAQEAVQQAIVDRINNQATKDLGGLDRRQRLADIGGTNYALNAGILADRGRVMASQRAQLAAQFFQAKATGNVALVDTLAESIRDLDVSILENTQAIKDNTDAAFAARVENINSAFGFQQSVMSGAVTFFQNLGKLTGQDTSGTVAGLLGGLGGALGTQRTGLLGALGDLLGYKGAEKTNLTNLQGEDLVNYLLSITSGPAFQSIMARLSPTQESQFQDLINALFANTTATQDNTSATEEALGLTKTQSFSSSWWTRFRLAIFNGGGDLLPQFGPLPVMDDGLGVAARDGAYFLRAGERVTWAGGEGGDTYKVYITEPTEVLDEATVGQKIAFHRRTRGR